jgi:hypothetical protein
MRVSAATRCADHDAPEQQGRDEEAGVLEDVEEPGGSGTAQVHVRLRSKRWCG